VDGGTMEIPNSMENKRVVYTFALASFLNDFGSDIIYPLWPLFVTTFLGANMVILGFVDGLGVAIVSISQAVSGYLSDRLGKRKMFIWIGYLFGSFSRIGYALSKTWQWLVPFKILDRSGKMRGAPRDAMVADASTDENRGSNFGLLRSMDHLGASCGIIASLLLFPRLGYQKLFLLAAVPSIIGSCVILVLIKERGTRDVSKGFSFKELDSNFTVFLLLSSIFAVGNFSYSFLLVYAKSLGFEASLVPVLYLIFTVVASLMAAPFGKIADKMGRKKVHLLAYLFFGLMCLGFLFVQQSIFMIPLSVLYGLHLAAIEPGQKTLASELAPTTYRASTLGTFKMVVGLASLPAGLIAGFLWESLGHWTPFAFALLLSIVSSILLVFVKEKKR
jgi:MFS family permease